MLIGHIQFYPEDVSGHKTIIFIYNDTKIFLPGEIQILAQVDLALPIMFDTRYKMKAATLKARWKNARRLYFGFPTFCSTTKKFRTFLAFISRRGPSKELDPSEISRKRSCLTSLERVVLLIKKIMFESINNSFRAIHNKFLE